MLVRNQLYKRKRTFLFLSPLANVGLICIEIFFLLRCVSLQQGKRGERKFPFPFDLSHNIYINYAFRLIGFSCLALTRENISISNAWWMTNFLFSLSLSLYFLFLITRSNKNNVKVMPCCFIKLRRFLWNCSPSAVAITIGRGPHCLPTIQQVKVIN